jgi:hypothetical protein
MSARHAFHFQRIIHNRLGFFLKRVRINTEIQRANDVFRLTLQANRLGDRENVPFVESQIERRAAMAGGAKRHPLRRHFGIGHQP